LGVHLRKPFAYRGNRRRPTDADASVRGSLYFFKLLFLSLADRAGERRGDRVIKGDPGFTVEGTHPRARIPIAAR
jgi:hypothetical protein